MKTTLILTLTLTAAAVHGQIPVTDGAVLLKTAAQVELASAQLEQLKLELKRWGDPAAVRAQMAPALVNSLGLGGVGQTGMEIRTSATGNAGVRYDGDGLYLPPDELVTTADGRQFERPLQPYKKFDAVTRARAALEDVVHDTEERRQALRGQIKSTVAQLQSAETMAHVQKLQGVLTAQQAELAAIDRERDAALARLLVVGVENQTDAARQEQARQDERLVDFRTASDKMGRLLTPSFKLVAIPDPRQRRP